MSNQNYENIEALADVIEPARVILTDPETKNKLSGGSMMDMAVYILKHHPKEIHAILAWYDGVPVEEYKCGRITPLVKLLKLINDPDMKEITNELFTLQV